MNTALQTVEPVQVAIRRARDVERKFVEGSWSRNTVQWDRQRGGPKPQQAVGIERAVAVGRPVDAVWIDAAELVRAHHRLVDEILSRDDVHLVVACLHDVPDSPIGWAAWQQDTLHFVYVSPVARRATVGKQLVLHSRCMFASHLTPDGLQLTKYLRRVPLR